jgi:hypothetical protein
MPVPPSSSSLTVSSFIHVAASVYMARRQSVGRDVLAMDSRVRFRRRFVRIVHPDIGEKRRSGKLTTAVVTNKVEGTERDFRPGTPKFELSPSGGYSTGTEN